MLWVLGTGRQQQIGHRNISRSYRADYTTTRCYVYLQ